MVRPRPPTPPSGAFHPPEPPSVPATSPGCVRNSHRIAQGVLRLKPAPLRPEPCLHHRRGARGLVGPRRPARQLWRSAPRPLPSRDCASARRSDRAAPPRPQKRKGEPCTLYSKGRILGYTRSKVNQYESRSLVKIESVNQKSDTDFYLGKRCAPRRRPAPCARRLCPRAAAAAAAAPRRALTSPRLRRRPGCATSTRRRRRRTAANSA